MSKKPAPIEKNTYLLSRVRLLEDRVTSLEGVLGRVADFLGYTAERQSEQAATLEILTADWPKPGEEPANAPTEPHLMDVAEQGVIEQALDVAVAPLSLVP